MTEQDKTLISKDEIMTNYRDAIRMQRLRTALKELQAREVIAEKEMLGARIELAHMTEAINRNASKTEQQDA